MSDTALLDTEFQYHTADTAPEAAKPLVEQTVATFGGLINLHALFAEAPLTYQSYLTSFDGFLHNSSFTPLEAQVVFMTANFHNRCHYCMAGHTMSMKAAKMPELIDMLIRKKEKKISFILPARPEPALLAMLMAKTVRITPKMPKGKSAMMEESETAPKMKVAMMAATDNTTPPMIQP